MEHVPPLFRVSCTPLPRGTEAAALALLSSAADFVMDVRFLAGALLGWRVLAAVGAAAVSPGATLAQPQRIAGGRAPGVLREGAVWRRCHKAVRCPKVGLLGLLGP
jgi:hypothetical protein